MAKDETEIGITGLPIPKRKRSPANQHKFEKERRNNIGTNVRGKKYEKDVNPYTNPRSVREEVLSYLLDEGFASDEKSAEGIMGAMSEAWIESIVEEFVDPEKGEAPSGRSPLENVSDHPSARVRRKAVKAFKKQMGKEYGGTWKSRSKDPNKD